jgi:hypothetical protein
MADEERSGLAPGPEEGLMGEDAPQAVSVSLASAEPAGVASGFGLAGKVTPLLQVASGAASLVGLAYLFGWSVAKAYYTALGAPWIVSDLNHIELLSFSGGVVKVMLAVFACYLSLLPRKPEHAKRGYWIGLSAQLVAGGLSLLSVVALNHSAYVLGSVLSGLSVMAWGICGSVGIALIMLLLRKPTFQNIDSGLYLLYFFVLVAMQSVPGTLGSWDGRIARLPSRSTLPRVILRDTPDSTVYLLRSDHGRLYLMGLSGEKLEPRFSIVDASDCLSVLKAGPPTKRATGSESR